MAETARQANICVMPGDGVGPEVTAEGIRVLEAIGRLYGHRFSFSEEPIGGNCIDKYGVALQPESLRRARRCDAVLFGAVGDP